MPNPPKKTLPATGSGEPTIATNPGTSQYSAAVLETQYGQYRMLSDLNASVAALRESVTLLRDDVRSNTQKMESKLDIHSTEIRDLMIEVRSYAKTVKVFGAVITILLAALTLLWSIGNKFLEWSSKK